MKAALEVQAAARGGRQAKDLREGGRKLTNMERTLEALLAQTEDEKGALKAAAAEEAAAAAAEAEELRRALALKNKELAQLRRLGREVRAVPPPTPAPSTFSPFRSPGPPCLCPCYANAMSELLSADPGAARRCCCSARRRSGSSSTRWRW